MDALTTNYSPQRMTLNEWYQIWMSNYKYHIVKESTIFLYRNCYNRYISYIGDLYLDEIQVIHIQNLFKTLIDSNLSMGTIQIVKRILNNMFMTAIKCEYMQRNPCLGTVLPREKKTSPRVLTIPEQNLFLKTIEGTFYEPLYRLALATGLRIGELTALSWNDIHFSERLISVNKTLLYQKNLKTNRYEYRFQTPKSSSSVRTIPLIPDAMMLLQMQKKNQEKYIGSFKTLPGFDNLVFTTINGTPIQEVYLIKSLRKITTAMNQEEQINAKAQNRIAETIENITPHTLRHSFATRAFEQGMSPKMVQHLMGHSNLAITMDLYTHVTLDAKRNEIVRIEDILKYES